MSDFERAARRASRRDALKKIGIGAGVAWSAPVAMGFFQPAAAGTPAPSTTETTMPPPNPECEGATCETFQPCSSNRNCVCMTTPDGPFCLPRSLICGDLDPCGADNACPDGFVCAIDTCCVTAVCVPLSLLAECLPGDDFDHDDDDDDDDSRIARRRNERVRSGAGTIGG